MAIQVSGTEVISNARALNNIASVDATTAAAISAGGVGGGTWTALQSVTVGNLSAGSYSSLVGYTSNKKTKQLTLKLNYTVSGYGQYQGGQLNFFLQAPLQNPTKHCMFTINSGSAPSGSYNVEIWAPLSIGAAAETYVTNTGTNNYLMGSAAWNGAIGTNLSGGFSNTLSINNSTQTTAVYYLDRFTNHFSIAGDYYAANTPSYGSVNYSQVQWNNSPITATNISYTLYGLV